MNKTRETLKKHEILRGRTILRSLHREGGRVNRQGITLFFWLPLIDVSRLLYRSNILAEQFNVTMQDVGYESFSDVKNIFSRIKLTF